MIPTIENKEPFPTTPDNIRPLSPVDALLIPPPKRRPPCQAGVREEDARLANDPPPPIIRATSLSSEDSQK